MDMKSGCGNLLKPAGLMLVAVFILRAPPAWSEPEYEQLLVFVQSGQSIVDREFQQSQLPKIHYVADQMRVPLHLIDARKGAPEEVAITPLIVFQNHRGRSIYQGRTTTPARLRNFIRTSRFVPQGSEPNRRENIPIRRIGRSRIWAPIKISSVTGTPPRGYDDRAFRSKALESIEAGFNAFATQAAADLGRADRGFYMDFYPWRSGDGTLFLSLALYSQFHCKEPVYTVKKEPLVGPWADRDRLFKKAAALMEAAVSRQIRTPETGDAYDPVATDVPIKTWEAIGFPLPPESPRRTVAAGKHMVLGPKWIVTQPGPDDPPLVQFRFPPPLDNNAGEVKTASGAITLSEGLKLGGATGFIEVDTRSAITMGEPVLDEAIRGSIMLYSKKFPAARFEIQNVESNESIAYGRLSPAVVKGTFTLKGKSVPLSCPAEFEPVIGDDGQPRLIARTSFRIDLREFDIEGADGPTPARHIVLLDVNLFMMPDNG